MSALVAQHQQASFPGPTNGSAGDATVVLGNDNATVTTYNAHDADPTIHVQSSSAATFAATPAATAGRKWMTNDTGAVYLYYDTGSAWVEANYLRQATSGVVTITSTTTPQLTVAYDGSHSATVSVSSAGVLTLNATSTVTITPATTISGGLTTTTVTTTGKIQATVTTEQLRLRYDTTHYLAVTVDSLGNAVYDLTGAGGIGHYFYVAGAQQAAFTSQGSVVSTALNVVGNFSVATSKLTVAAATGNTVVAGTLSATGRVVGSAGYTTDAAKTAALLHIYGNVVSTTVLGRFESSDRRVDIYSDEIRSAGSYLTLNGDGVTGVAVGSPTGGNKGGGTCNFAGDIYKNNSAYTNPHYAFEHWATGKIVKYADREGASTYKGRMSLTDLEAYVREHHHFPRITDEPAGGFHRSDIALELIEEAFTHLIDQRRETFAEITALRQEVAALKTVSG